MVSMRGALKEPAFLVVVIPWQGGSGEQERLEQAWFGELGGAGGVPKAWLEGSGWLAWVSRWSSGAEARDAWGRMVCSSAWREGAASVKAQPTVHILVEQETPWPSEVPEGGAWSLACVTRDATLQTRAERSRGERPRMALPERAALPELPGGRLWPVLGHPGRLFVVVAAFEMNEALGALEAHWGPWVEEAQRWEGGSVSDRRGS